MILEKNFGYFSQLPSLREYVLIEQDSWKVEKRATVAQPRRTGRWPILREKTPKSCCVSVGIKLPIAQIYQDIDDF